MINTFNFTCIHQEPEEIQIGRSYYVTKQSGHKRRKVLTRDTFYYVPLLSTLEQILQIQSVRNEVLQPHNNSEFMYDISDGYIFKHHGFFKDNPRGLQIVAYYDEVETCNPLGSSSGKFKLGCVFFTLTNIRPQLRSGLKAIFLLAVAKSPIIKKHGIDSILKPFLDDLKTLYNVGLRIQFAGKEEVWKGALLAFLADNLAAHELGGFKESFSFARKFCRSCLTDKEFSQSHFREDDFEMRNGDSHAEQCKLLDGPNGLSDSVKYGINRHASLDLLPHFSVAENMPHDIMHDLFEGAIPYELKMLFHYCFNQSFISLNTLNHRLKSFDFGYSEIGDRPAPIEDASKLRQTASQMWLLAKSLPMLIGDLIPRDNSNWTCFLKLLNICEICIAPVLSADSAAYLELLIEEHHTQFKTLYDRSIIPKLHFMVHFPCQILKFGPLIHTWTMRHEAKLRIIKRAARVSNFKNVCQTVAKRHQHLLCFYIQSKLLFSQDIKTGPCKQGFISAQPEDVQVLLDELYQLTEESILFTTSYATYNGATFKPNAFILVSYDVLEPVFGKITAIIKTELEEIIVVFKEYVTEFYDSHYRAFSITESTSRLLHNTCSIKNLTYYTVFHLRRTFSVDNKVYITFRSHIEM